MTLAHSTLFVSSLLLIVLAAACGGDEPTSQVHPATGGSAGCANCGGDGGTPDAGGAENSTGGVAGAHAAGCVPLTCEAQGAECGTVADGCGVLLDCGTCEVGLCGAVQDNVCGCPEGGITPTSQTRIARRARSAGFAGTATQYGDLYGIVCTEPTQCSEPCLASGGTQEMCDASECLEAWGGGKDCLPAPVWTNLESVRSEATALADAMQLVVIDGAYSDALLLDSFGFALPANAIVEGIVFDVRQAAGALVTDDSVNVLKAGEPGTAEHATDAAWSDGFEWVARGAEDDLWGETWTAADVNDDGFGLALSVLYGNTVGNTRAYVDQVSATVHYSLACE